MRITLRTGLEAGAVLFCSATTLLAQEGKHPITFDDMIQLHRVSDPKISPDGMWVAYEMATPDIDANRNASNLWIVSTAGSAPIQLTQSGHDSSPECTPTANTLPSLPSPPRPSQLHLLP